QEGINYQDVLNDLINTQSLDAVYEKVVQNIKAITSYDRVMLYKFDKEYNGQVISEAKEDDLQSYLHLHYPSTDIPPQARQLYLKNPIRIIQSVDYEAAGIQSITKDPIDMSLSFLRSVSPIHLQYMKNMGVYASMTISIIIDNKLWGLIACHHRKEFFPNLQTMKLCEDIAQSVGSLIDIYQKKEYESAKSRFLATIDTIVTILKQKMTTQDINDFIFDNLEMFKPLFHADGVVFVTAKKIESCCVSLQPDELEVLVQTLTAFDFEQSFYTDSLADHCQIDEVILKKCAGILIVRLPIVTDSFMIFTKSEEIEKIDWGGDPAKAGQSLNPRKSFEKYSQTITNKALPWSENIDKKLHIFHQKIEDLFVQHRSYKTLKVQEDLILSLEKQKIKNYNQLIEMLVTMIEQRDAYTAGHTQRVAYYCKLIAQKMGFKKRDVALIEQAAKLHDIGKISIPDSILLKPGRLNSNEYHLIKQHLDVGYSILNKIDSYKEIAQIMACHHEKYDGSGYPEGKKAEEIPLLSHIMIVADALDAMTTNRIYQSRKSLEEAVEEIEVLQGVWYHPEVVASLKALYDEGLELSCDTSQLPLTSMEYERFSYFFKDPLTSFFNESYLWLVLHESLPHKKLREYVLIETKGVTKYNKAYGWQKGSQLIGNVAKHIQKQAEFGEFFRVFGDDFIVGFETPNGKDKFLNEWQDYSMEGVYTKMQQIPKDAVIATMNTFW
ncbi:MAG: HD domain-containing phosphohydrolase, partial [Campylobacterota bacterium]